jgi:hypothetical protein
MDIIEKFPEQNRKQFFVLVWTDPDMKENEIAVLNFDDGLKCLGNDPVNKERRISVVIQNTTNLGGY